MSTREARTRAEQWNNRNINPLTGDNCELDLNTITNVVTGWDTADGYERHYVFKSDDSGDIEHSRSNLNGFKGLYFKKATIANVEGVLVLPVYFTNATRANVREKKVGVVVDANSNIAFVDKEKNILVYEYIYYFRRTDDRNHQWVAKDNLTMGFNYTILQKSKYLIELFKDVYGKDLRFRDRSSVNHALDEGYERTIWPSRQVVKTYYVTNPCTVSRFLQQKKKKPASEATIKKNKKIEDVAKGIVSDEMMEAIVNQLNSSRARDYARDFVLMRSTEKGIGMMKYRRNSVDIDSDYTLDSITLFEKNKTPMYVEVHEDGTYKREKFLTDSYATNNKMVVIDNNLIGPAKYVKDYIATNFEEQKRLNVDGLTFYKGSYGWSESATKYYMVYIRHLFCDKNGLLEKVLKLANENQKDIIQENNGDIKVIFGEIPEKVKSNNLYQLLGINKYQFDTNTDDTIKFVKYITGRSDISEIDKETWDEIRSLFNNSEFCFVPNKLSYNSNGAQNSWYFHRIISSLRLLLSRTRETEIPISTIKKVLKLSERNGDAVPAGYGYYYRDTATRSRTLCDYLSNLETIKIRSEEDFDTFPIVPSNFAELDALHTRSNLLLGRLRDMDNKELDEKLTNKYQKLKKERADMEMENDKYMIFCPTCPEDLRSEGRVQSICIGGYVENYARESSKLFLLRKKECPEIPFFAIEVNNNDVVVQCHGKYNRWLGHNDDSYDAVTFVVEWLLKNNFICARTILTNQSGGYCSNGCCRELPDNEIIRKARENRNITG